MSLVNKPGNDGIVLTQEMIDKMNKKLEPKELPDTTKIADTVIDILEVMNTNEMIKLQKQDKIIYEDEMEKKFQDFANRYRSMFMRIISGEDIETLVDMLEAIEDIKSGKNQDEVENKLKEDLEEKFIYSNMTEEEKRKVKNRIKKDNKN